MENETEVRVQEGRPKQAQKRENVSFRATLGMIDHWLMGREGKSPSKVIETIEITGNNYSKIEKGTKVTLSAPLWKTYSILLALVDRATEKVKRGSKTHIAEEYLGMKARGFHEHLNALYEIGLLDFEEKKYKGKTMTDIYIYPYPIYSETNACYLQKYRRVEDRDTEGVRFSKIGVKARLENKSSQETPSDSSVHKNAQVDNVDNHPVDNVDNLPVHKNARVPVQKNAQESVHKNARVPVQKNAHTKDIYIQSADAPKNQNLNLPKEESSDKSSSSSSKREEEEEKQNYQFILQEIAEMLKGKIIEPEILLILESLIKDGLIKTVKMNHVTRAWELYKEWSRTDSIVVPHRFFKRGILIAMQEELANKEQPPHDSSTLVRTRPVPFVNWLESDNEEIKIKDDDLPW